MQTVKTQMSCISSGSTLFAEVKAILGDLNTSVFPTIDYNRKSFIYSQSIDDRMEFQGIDYNRKSPQVKEFHFYLTPNANFCSILVMK